MGKRRRILACLTVIGVVLAMGAPSGGQDSPRTAPSTDARRTSVAGAAAEGELLYATEGNRLRRFDVDTIGTGGFAEDVLIPAAGDEDSAAAVAAAEGRDINGEICFFPDGSGRFVAGEDTGQPHPPPGWGVFDAGGTQIGKLASTYLQSGAEPHGCEFAPDGTLFTGEVGFQGFGTANGQLIMWFPPYDRFPGPPGAYPNTDATSTHYCKLATDLGTAGGVAIDHLGRVYVAQSSGLRIERFSPPFPTGPDAAGGCGRVDSTGAPLATTVNREVFTGGVEGVATFSGLAMAPNGNLYASSVFTGRIGEFDLDGNLVRLILAPEQGVPPIPTGHPQGLAVGGDGTLYFADLDLVGTLPDVGPGPNGKVRRIRFAPDGTPLPPEIVRDGLAFPDGVAIAAGDLETPEPEPPEPWPTLAGSPNRTFFNPDETRLNPDTVGDLVEKWRAPTNAVVTSSPTIAEIERGGRTTKAVFFTSWDGYFYAVDFDDGHHLWRVPWEKQPGASFPAAGSPTVADIGGRRTVFVAAGEILYALDAATGAEVWRFTAGTGCRDASGNPPGLCSFTGERNQIESTPLVAEGTVYIGMDINDVETGKGGFYALDADDGALTWYFDLETSSTCRPDPADEIRRYDGYHSESELGLPAGFFASRTGCGHDRTTTGCGNVWSSAAHDPERRLLYFSVSNCDTDDDPTTPRPGPTMPPHDEALVAMHTDGTHAWTWRPREVDNDDLSFGAVPNLFSIDVEGTPTEVVGLGGKDGTYYVIDRDGVNERTGARWDDDDTSGVPYWRRNVVPGGDIGGIIATASVDQAAGRVYFSTAPGLDVFEQQQPTVHALDIDTGEIVWQNRETAYPGSDASYGPTSGVPGLVIVGSVILPHLRIFDSGTGDLLYDENIGQPGTLSGIASGAAVIDGTLLVGAGIGTLTSSGSSPGDFAANTPSALIALCVRGTGACPEEVPRIVPGLATVTEGDDGTTVARVPVDLSVAADVPVSAKWETVAGAGDLVAASGTVTFAPGETSAVVEVEVNGDRLDEADEIGIVHFFDPVNGRPGGFFGLGFVKVLDDDPLPTVRSTTRLVIEGDGPRQIRIPVSLSAPSGRAVSVDWATFDGTAKAPADYVGNSGRVVFAPGTTRADVWITITGDDRRELAEWFWFGLSSPTNTVIARDRSLVLVLDDDH